MSCKDKEMPRHHRQNQAIRGKHTTREESNEQGIVYRDVEDKKEEANGDSHHTRT